MKIMNIYRKWQFKRVMGRGIKILETMDRVMHEQKWPRSKMRQFWRDFYKFPDQRRQLYEGFKNDIKNYTR